MEEDVKIYISKPMRTSYSLTDEACNKIKGYGGVPFYWDEDTHYIASENIEKADIVVVLVEDLLKHWNSYPLAKFTKGVEKEIRYAIANQIEVRFCYRTADDIIRMYRMECDGHSIRKISGSGESLLSVVHQMKGIKKANKDTALAKMQAMEALGPDVKDEDWGIAGPGKKEKSGDLLKKLKEKFGDTKNTPQQIPVIPNLQDKVKDSKFSITACDISRNEVTLMKSPQEVVDYINLHNQVGVMFVQDEIVIVEKVIERRKLLLLL